eukprot:g4216.t1
MYWWTIALTWFVGVVLAQNSCGSPRIRTAWRTWSCAQRAQFFNSLQQMRDNGALQRLTNFHIQAACYAHNEVAFLGWHRDFLMAFENSLRSTVGGSCLTVPYWDWEHDSDNSNNMNFDRIAVLSPFTFGNRSNVDAFSRVNVAPINTFIDYDEQNRGTSDTRIRRTFDSRTISTASRVLSVIQDNNNFEDFADELEGSPHVNLHFFYGGTMSTFGSPGDLIFYLHHCNVDRIWAMWQVYHGFADDGSQLWWRLPDGRARDVAFSTSSNNNGRNGCGDTNSFNTRMRFTDSGRTFRDTFSIQALGYAYGADTLVPLLGSSRFNGASWFVDLGVAPVEVACCGDNVLSGAETCDDGKADSYCVEVTECGMKADPCFGKTCSGRGTCSDGKCSCTDGFRGTDCEIDDCQGVVCQNDGTCRREGGGTCSCKAGFSGKLCQVSACDGKLCGQSLGRGSCVLSSVGKAECVCLDAWTGADCSTHICTAVTCLNGGTCAVASPSLPLALPLSLSIATAKCKCKEGFSGDLCEKDACEKNKCNVANNTGNVCRAAVCICSADWSGTNCSTAVPRLAATTTTTTPATTTSTTTTSTTTTSTTPSSTTTTTTTKPPTTTTTTTTTPTSTAPTTTTTTTTTPTSTTPTTTTTTTPSTTTTQNALVAFLTGGVCQDPARKCAAALTCTAAGHCCAPQCTALPNNAFKCQWVVEGGECPKPPLGQHTDCQVYKCRKSGKCFISNKAVPGTVCGLKDSAAPPGQCKSDGTCIRNLLALSLDKCLLGQCDVCKNNKGYCCTGTCDKADGSCSWSTQDAVCPPLDGSEHPDCVKPACSKAGVCRNVFQYQKECLLGKNGPPEQQRPGLCNAYGVCEAIESDSLSSVESAVVHKMLTERMRDHENGVQSTIPPFNSQNFWRTVAYKACVETGEEAPPEDVMRAWLTMMRRDPDDLDYLRPICHVEKEKAKFESSGAAAALENFHIDHERRRRHTAQTLGTQH